MNPNSFIVYIANNMDPDQVAPKGSSLANKMDPVQTAP